MLNSSHAFERDFDGPGTEAIGKTYHGTSGDDTRTGTHRDDTFDYGQGGEDTLKGAKGNDTFNMGAAFDAGDSINGGVGNDVLNLNGNYVNYVVVGTGTLVNVETIKVTAGYDYSLDMSSATIPAGSTLTVDGTALGRDNGLFFEVENGNDGHVIVKGGAGSDLLEGGNNSDTIFGGKGNDDIDGANGADKESGGGGHDQFFYRAVSNSTGSAFDTITDFNANQDKFLVATNDVSGVDHKVVGGTLDTGTFNSDLEAAIGSQQLHKHHAVLFVPDAGHYAGKIFLIIDANNHAGYQADKDYVIELDGATHLATFGLSNFTPLG